MFLHFCFFFIYFFNLSHSREQRTELVLRRLFVLTWKLVDVFFEHQKASFSHITLNSFAVLRTNPRKNQLQISLFVYKVSGKERRNSEVTRISGGKSRLSLVHKFTNHARLSEEIHASRILKLWRNKTMRTITLNSYPATSV